jgi:hypothetical protein
LRVVVFFRDVVFVAARVFFGAAFLRVVVLPGRRPRFGRREFETSSCRCSEQ